jgi:hypothetical protein
VTFLRRRSRRWALYFVVAVVGCLTVVVGRWYWHRHQVSAAAQQSMEELNRDDPGWRLADLEAARAVLPDGDNAAVCVREAHELLVPEKEDINLFNQIRRAPPNERLGPKDRADVGDQMQKQRQAVEKARTLADRPRGRFSILYQRNPLKIDLTHLGQARSITSLLCCDAAAQAEDGDVTGALRSCRAALNAGRAIGDEPFEFSQLYRASCVQEASAAVERVLGQGEGDADEMRRLQELAQDEERYPRLLAILRGRRALVNELLDGVESGEVSLDDLGTQLNGGLGDASDQPASVDEVRADHARLIVVFTEMVQLARLPAHRRREPVRDFEAARRANPEADTVFRLLPVLRQLDASTRRTDARLRCLVTALAVERYRLRQHRWPAALDELVPDLLTAVPVDSGDGLPLGYRRYADHVVVFSRLNAPAWPFGALSPASAFNPDQPSPANVGIAFHLFDVARRQSPTSLPPIPRRQP